MKMGNKGKIGRSAIYSVSAFVLLSTSTAVGAGFEVLEQSSKGLGQAFAGKSAGLGDGSEVYFNPAAMSALQTDIFTVGSAIVIPSAKFRNNGSTQASGAPLTGTDGGDGGSAVAVPSAYYVGTLNDKFKLGLGLNAPFGLKSNYDPKWIGRYHAIKSDLMSININPAISYKALDRLTIGLGLNNVYLDTELTNAIDFGTIAASRLGVANAAALGLSPQNSDGFARLAGNDWAHGFNAGLLWDFSDQTRVGVSFRTKLESTVVGDVRYQVPNNAQILTSTGLFKNSPAEAEVTLPETFSIGLNHDVNDRLALSAEGTWTRWTRFKELRVDFPEPLPDSVVEENWENTWRIAGGINYNITPCLQVRTGVAWDETPVWHAPFRTPRIPDEKRIWATIGSSWYATDNMKIDVAYAHLFMDDAPSSNVSATGDTLLGNYDLDIDIFSVGFTWELS